jgi:ParB family chromosome partitioning protein
VLPPLLLRPNGKGFDLVAGSRRLKAAPMAGLTTVPATIRELSGNEVLELQSIEKVQREDVHPMDEAEGYERQCSEEAQCHQGREEVNAGR